MNRAQQFDPSDRRLRRTLRRTRGVMLLERGLRALWRPAAIVAVVWALLALGLADIAPPPVSLAGLGLAAAAALWFLVAGFREFRWPAEAEAVARLDDALPGRPMAALSDTQALGAGDAGSQAVWTAHLARMRRLADAARAPRPDPRLRALDPWALRLAALVLLIAAGLFARGDGFEAVTAALGGAGAETAPAGPTFEGWAEPPLYTGRPTLYLPEVSGDEALSVPAGTRVTLRAYGASERFGLSETVSGAGGTALAQASEGIASSEFEVTRDGIVTLSDRADPLRSWNFTVEPDLPPEIALARPVDRALSGEMQLGFEARDDHGVVAGSARITLDLGAVDRSHGLAADPEPRDAIVVDLPLPLTGESTEIAETLVEDFSGHPWVGLPVTIELVARDAIDQEGSVEVTAAELPGRRFYNPLARALVEQRRDLLWSAENGPRTLQVLRAATWRPDAVFSDGASGAYLVARTAIRRLDAAVDAGAVPAARDEIAEALWEAALLLEEGSLGDAAERLARARERLAEALRDDSTTDEEIAELMQELREATRDYMEQMAREAIERGDTQSAEAPPPGQTMSQDQIQELMDRIQELSEQGRRAEAEALLEMLQQLLENMEMMVTQGGQGQPGEGQQGQGQQLMDELGQTLREQQGLADDSFQQLQREFREGRNNGQPGQPGAPGEQQARPGEEPSQGGEGQALAERQEALRELLEDLQGQMPGATGDGARQALEDAERSMGEARDALREGQTADALDSQSEAIDNLRDGVRQMAEDMRQAEQGATGQGTEQGQATNENNNDPLGRPAGTRGAIGADSDMLPDGDAAARARKLVDEIRRRSGEQMRPQIELDYLRRLLDRF